MGRSTLVLLALLVGACESSPAAPPAVAAAPPPVAASGPPAAAASAAPAVGMRVDGKAAKALVKDGARLVDVRTPTEYADKHVEGAANVPVDTISDADLGPKDAPLVLYCGSGKRSKKAVETLRARGYTRLYDLGAMSNWDE